MSAYNNYVSKTHAQRTLTQRDSHIKQKTAIIMRQKEMEVKHLHVDSTYNCGQQLIYHITDKLDSLNNDFPWRLDEYKKMRESILKAASELLDLKSTEEMDNHAGVRELRQFGTIDWFAKSFFNGEWQLSAILKAFINNQHDPHFDVIFDYLFHKATRYDVEDNSEPIVSRQSVSPSGNKRRRFDNEEQEGEEFHESRSES
jgi:hypothetical protein